MIFILGTHSKMLHNIITIWQLAQMKSKKRMQDIKE
jgi:hypothetical protein